jgi:DNA-binding transcriptional LysR family regulator
MDPFSGLMAFVKAADLGSFVAAGSALGRSPSAIGKAVARLEREAGVRLIQRNTRRMQLTVEGRQFHERCRGILGELADAQAALARSREAPRGLLRVSAPVVGHHFLLPVLPAFLASCPEVELDLQFTSGIDVAIRSGDLRDSGLAARPLQAFHLGLWAAPTYLQGHGAPTRWRDLAQHTVVRFRHPSTGKLLDWPVADGIDPDTLRVRRTVACNHIEAVLGAALSGLGIVCLPDFLVRELVATGRLQPVLPEVVHARGRFHALWSAHRQPAPKVRAFIDHLRDHLRDPAP